MSPDFQKKCRNEAMEPVALVISVALFLPPEEV